MTQIHGLNMYIPYILAKGRFITPFHVFYLCLLSSFIIGLLKRHRLEENEKNSYWSSRACGVCVNNISKSYISLRCSVIEILEIFLLTCQIYLLFSMLWISFIIWLNVVSTPFEFLNLNRCWCLLLFNFFSYGRPLFRLFYWSKSLRNACLSPKYLTLRNDGISALDSIPHKCLVKG